MMKNRRSASVEKRVLAKKGRKTVGYELAMVPKDFAESETKKTSKQKNSTIQKNLTDNSKRTDIDSILVLMHSTDPKEHLKIAYFSPSTTLEKIQNHFNCNNLSKDRNIYKPIDQNTTLKQINKDLKKQIELYEMLDNKNNEF